MKYDEIYRIINKSRCTACRDRKGFPAVRDSVRDFRGLPVSEVNHGIEIFNAGIKGDMEAAMNSKFVSPAQVHDACMKARPALIDAIRGRMPGNDAVRVVDSIVNQSLGIGTGDDLLGNNMIYSNLWIDPGTAASLFSQKGLLETVINKKSKSILLNGLKVRNPRFSPKQIDTISENNLRLNVPEIVSSGLTDSLVFGGNLEFPMYKDDNAVTLGQPVVTLLKAGVIKKHSIDRFISLDRWNTWIVPPVTPVQRDFLEPDVYFIPYFGCDVHHSRTARMVTSPQAGWWGKILTQGWGISDFCGYYRSYEQLNMIMSTLPYMIQQMSILVRTVNMDAQLAMNASNALENILADNQINIRKATAANPIDMDVVGDVKAIDRNFDQVPELIKIQRQQFAADTGGIPEPMLFSSEKGNFSSGDDTQGNLSKQWEGVKYIHKQAELQLRRTAMLLVIDALGPTNEVIEALPYTTIQFDSPMIANATEKADIADKLADAMFKLVASNVPMDISAEVAFSYGSDEMSLSSDTLDKLKRIQAIADKRAEDKFNLEIQQGKESVAAQKNSNVTVKAASSGKGTGNTSKAKYTPLEQKKHEKTRVGLNKRKEGLAKAAGKKQS